MAKANMAPTRCPMPSQDPKARARNFDEVALGYTEEMAMEEASRCLECKNMPCVSGCPVNIHIPAFIAKIKEGQFEQAYQIIATTSSLPAVCGRVCPQETSPILGPLSSSRPMVGTQSRTSKMALTFMTLPLITSVAAPFPARNLMASRLFLIPLPARLANSIPLVMLVQVLSRIRPMF